MLGAQEKAEGEKRKGGEGEEILILAVKERRPLWDPAVHFYKNNSVLKLLWEEVAQETGLTELQAKNRWKSLRDYYRLELKKTMLDTEGKKSNWVFFQAMSFLKNMMCSSRVTEENNENLKDNSEKPINSTRSSNSTSVENQLQNQKPFVVSEQEIHNSCNGSKEADHSVQNEALTSAAESAPPVVVGGRNPLKIRPPLDLAQRRALIHLECRRIELLERAARREEDDDLLFFKSLLPMMKSLPNSKKMRLRLLFQKIICEETEKINHN